MKLSTSNKRMSVTRNVSVLSIWTRNDQVFRRSINRYDNTTILEFTHSFIYDDDDDDDVLDESVVIYEPFCQSIEEEKKKHLDNKIELS